METGTLTLYPREHGGAPHRESCSVWRGRRPYQRVNAICDCDLGHGSCNLHPGLWPCPCLKGWVVSDAEG